MPRFGDLNVGLRIGEAGALQFGVLRVDHQASEQRQAPAEQQLLVAIVEAEIRDGGIADGLADAGDALDT